MSIERTSPLKPIATVQARETAEPALSPVNRPDKTASATRSSVTFSSAQAHLMQAASSDINMARVNALKTAIRNGELNMDSGKIADALIHEAQRFPQSQ